MVFAVWKKTTNFLAMKNLSATPLPSEGHAPPEQLAARWLASAVVVPVSDICYGPGSLLQGKNDLPDPCTVYSNSGARLASCLELVGVAGHMVIHEIFFTNILVYNIFLFLRNLVQYGTLCFILHRDMVLQKSDWPRAPSLF